MTREITVLIGKEIPDADLVKILTLSLDKRDDKLAPTIEIATPLGENVGESNTLTELTDRMGFTVSKVTPKVLIYSTLPDEEGHVLAEITAPQGQPFDHRQKYSSINIRSNYDLTDDKCAHMTNQIKDHLVKVRDLIKRYFGE